MVRLAHHKFLIESSIHSAKFAQLAEAAQYLRDDEQFTMCVDITAVDHLVDGVRHQPVGVEPERFEVVANFLSHPRNRRIRLICEVPESDPSVPSLTDVYPGTNFPERETYDLLGITFEGHPDLTRILMPDEFTAFPLRKDYPLRGRGERHNFPSITRAES